MHRTHSHRAIAGLRTTAFAAAALGLLFTLGPVREASAGESARQNTNVSSPRSKAPRRDATRTSKTRSKAPRRDATRTSKTRSKAPRRDATRVSSSRGRSERTGAAHDAMRRREAQRSERRTRNSHSHHFGRRHLRYCSDCRSAARTRYRGRHRSHFDRRYCFAAHQHHWTWMPGSWLRGRWESGFWLQEHQSHHASHR